MKWDKQIFEIKKKRKLFKYSQYRKALIILYSYLLEVNIILININWEMLIDESMDMLAASNNGYNQSIEQESDTTLVIRKTAKISNRNIIIVSYRNNKKATKFV